MKIIRKKIKILIIFLSTFILINLITISTKSESEYAIVSPWTNPKRLSQANQFANMPYIVSDSSGVIHAVWSANTLEPDLIDEQLDTIYYSKIIKGEVQSQNDIFAAKPGHQVRVSRLRIDENNYLHLVYFERPGFVYARAYASLANEPKQWFTYHFAEDAYMADFTFGPNNSLEMVYVEGNSGIYFIRSKDNGVSWSSPVTIAAFDSNHSSKSVRIERDTDGVLHVAWGFTSRYLDWNPEGIAYARSLDNGLTWVKTLEIKEGDNYPNIGIDGQGILHLVWDNPAVSELGRGHASSNDGGVTWNRVERIFPKYRGQTLYPVLVLDSGNNFYLITAANPPITGRPSIFLSTWQNFQWTQPALISGEIRNCESPSVAIALGNQIYVAWNSFHIGEEGIYYSSAYLNTPSNQPILLKNPTESPSEPSPSPLIIPTVQEAENKITNNYLNDRLPEKTPNPTQPMIVGVFLSIIFIGSMGIIILLKKRR